MTANKDRPIGAMRMPDGSSAALVPANYVIARVWETIGPELAGKLKPTGSCSLGLIEPVTDVELEQIRALMPAYMTLD